MIEDFPMLISFKRGIFMVKVKIDNKKLFQCEVCGYGYLDRETAQRCEDWCRKTGTCSAEIMR
jgi:hypothetical protein